ncbi:MAG: nitroreductase [Prevotella sp.]|nr:nitroreductase [Prevotella sp.]
MITDNQLLEAIPARHSVRHYLSREISRAVLDELRAETERCNARSGLNIQLVAGEKRAFSGPLAYGKFSGVENYFAMIGEKASGLDFKIGYFGERLVLAAQALGLNTCWAGLSYRSVRGAYIVGTNEKLACMIALGYGATQGHGHKTKTVEQISNAAVAPEWFRRGVEAALLAPSAINQQKYSFVFTPAKHGLLPQVIARRGASLVGYTKMDIAIAALHFELAAGKEHFTWAGHAKFLGNE